MSLLTASDQMQNSVKPYSSDEIIRLENVSVVYNVPHERIGTFKEFIIRWVERKIKFDKFLALREINLTVSRGEVLGLIGHNGAGKSTLLKLVARVLPPTKGRVWVKGRVAPLLELGAGFHPDLTGRENVFLNGALLGFSRRQMEAKFKDIVDFAELWDFIDAPIRTYSSGMLARLGFAVATDSQPDILIVDEILGVGDEDFQAKCAERIRSYRKRGTAILMVSHDMNTVQSICNRTVFLDHGEVKFNGITQNAISAYRA
jgi:ABC-2 type transport system ATP-binding protein